MNIDIIMDKDQNRVFCANPLNDVIIEFTQAKSLWTSVGLEKH